MPQGMQVYDASGNLVSDVTDRMTRILGITFITPGQVLNIVDDGFLTGNSWYETRRVNNTEQVGDRPSVSVIGNTMTVDNSVTAFMNTRRFAYGVY